MIFLPFLIFLFSILNPYLSFLPFALPSLAKSSPSFPPPDPRTFSIPSLPLLAPPPRVPVRLLNDGRVYPRADKGLTPRYARRSRRYGQFLLVRAGLITSFMAHSRGGDRPDHVLPPPVSAPDRWNRRPRDGRQQPGHNTKQHASAAVLCSTSTVLQDST